MVGMVAEVEAGGWPTHVSGEWTVEMLDALPDDNLKYELLDGTLLVSPLPVPLHQAVIGSSTFCCARSVHPATLCSCHRSTGGPTVAPRSNRTCWWFDGIGSE